MNVEDEKPRALLALVDLAYFLKTPSAIERSCYQGHLESTAHLVSAELGSFFYFCQRKEGTLFTPAKKLEA